MAKPSILVIHWKESEAPARLELVRSAGYVARWGGDDGKAVGARLKQKRPDVIVIDLGRLPSHGREVAGWLREHKDWRSVPLVFVAGDPEKTERMRADLPDAVYVDEWEQIGRGLREALARPPSARPAKIDRPDYSGTPLAKKLGIGEGAKVVLLNAPTGFERTLAPLPRDVKITTRSSADADVVVLFVRTRSELGKRLAGPAKALQPGSGLWIAWPKKGAGTNSDLDGNLVRTTGLATGLVDNKVCAVDAVWSGLRFVVRRAAGARR